MRLDNSGVSTFNTEFTSKLEILFFSAPSPVYPPRLAQLRGASGGVRLAEQGVAPAPLSRKQEVRVASGLPSALTTKGRLKLAGTGPGTRMAKAIRDMGERRLFSPGPRSTVPGWKTPPVERREASVFLTKHAAPSPRCQT